MANKDHVKRFREGAKAWNAWRKKNPEIRPDLFGADLSVFDFGDMNLRGAELGRAIFNFSDLTKTNFTGADLTWASLCVASLHRANFTRANLSFADFTYAVLHKANLSRAILTATKFGGTDLSTVKGLGTVRHYGPSIIDIHTLFNSSPTIPEIFLRGVGVPEPLITYLASLTARPIEFHSCFISYSHKDQQFSERLHSRLRQANLRVWYAPEDMQAGKKLHEEIFRAIQIHDKLLLVLSESSMQSEWVMTEIRRARKVEHEEKRRKLFPIRLVDFETIQKWECFDADSGKDLAVELREYYIPDFSNWKNHDIFEAEFAKLLRDLRSTEK